MADTRGIYLNEILRQYGLESLSDWAHEAIINDWSQEQFVIELYKRPEFQKRFAGMFQLEANKRPPISVEEYLAYERAIHAQAAMWGMTLEKDLVDQMIGNEVSNVEAQGRFDLAAEAMYESDDETIAELMRMSNVQSGDIMLYFMNPKEEYGKLQNSFRQAQIAGAAMRTGWGQLSQIQAQRLQETGMTREQSMVGFGELARMGEALKPFALSEDVITEEDQVEFLAGDVVAAQKIEGRIRSRLAEFEGSGGFAAGEGGFAVGAAES